MAFLRARLDEDESIVMATCGQRPNPASITVPHGPARLLAEVAAKRAILDEWQRFQAVADEDIRLDSFADGLGAAVDCLAQPYAWHVDFDPAWRVPAS
jgi:hypothetical protein